MIIINTSNLDTIHFVYDKIIEKHTADICFKNPFSRATREEIIIFHERILVGKTSRFINRMYSDIRICRELNVDQSVIDEIEETVNVIKRRLLNTLTLGEMKKLFDEHFINYNFEYVAMDIVKWPLVLLRAFHRKWKVTYPLWYERPVNYKGILSVKYTDLDKLDKVLQRLSLGFPKMYTPPIFSLLSCDPSSLRE